MPGLAMSNAVNSGMLSTSATSAASSASQRAACGRELPTSRHSAPPRIGSHTSRLRSGMEECKGMLSKGTGLTSLGSLSVPVADEDGQQRDQAEDHREGVVVEITRLAAAQHAGREVDEAHAAVDGAVDHVG